MLTMRHVNGKRNDAERSEQSMEDERMVGAGMSVACGNKKRLI